jgi:hypothetical protein
MRDGCKERAHKEASQRAMIVLQRTRHIARLARIPRCASAACDANQRWQSNWDRALEVALLAASVDVHQRESCAAAAAVRFDGDDVLVIFSSDFEFGNRAGIVTFAL